MVRNPACRMCNHCRSRKSPTRISHVLKVNLYSGVFLAHYFTAFRDRRGCLLAESTWQAEDVWLAALIRSSVRSQPFLGVR